MPSPSEFNAMADSMSAENDRVHRISHLLSTVFLQFRYTTWHTGIRNVTKRNEFLAIEDDTRAIYRMRGWWSIFPDFCVDMKDQRNSDAVLTTKACYDLAHMTVLTEQLFEGMDTQLEEVVLRLKDNNMPLRSIITYEDRRIDYNDYDFWILRATSAATGQVWAIHLASAQYFMPDSVSLWEEFEKNWVHKILAIRPLGTLQRYAMALAETKSTAGLEAKIQISAMAAWHAAVDPAMAKVNLTWKTVLDKNEADFRRHSEKILEKGRKGVHEFVRSQNLNKRRLKAERYEKRHGEWKKEGLRLLEEVAEYQPRDVVFKGNGFTWLVSEHSKPLSERLAIGNFRLGLEE